MRNQRLQKRGKRYYIRYIVPRFLQSILRKKEIKFSLKTSNYQEALFRLHLETSKINWIMDTLKYQKEHSLYEELYNMKVISVSGIKFILLDDKETDKIILERIDAIYGFLNTVKFFQQQVLNRAEETDIQNLRKVVDTGFENAFLNLDWNNYYDLTKNYFSNLSKGYSSNVLSYSRWDNYISNNMKRIIEELEMGIIYIHGIKPLTLNEVQKIKKVFNDCDCNFYPIKELENIDLSNLPINHHLLHCLKSADLEVKRIYNDYYLKNIDVNTFKITYSLQNYYEVYLYLKDNEEKNKRKSIVDNFNSEFDLELKYTGWEDLFNDYWNMKRNQQPIEDDRKATYKRVISLFFDLINKKSVSQITKQDCTRYVENLVYRIPKHYTLLKEYKNKKAIDILLDSPDKEKCLNKKTISTYLTPIKELLNYAYEHDALSENFAPIFHGPKITRKDKTGKREIFNTNELVTIIKNLPNANKSPTEFFLVFLGMFEGIRLNEGCSLLTKDINKQGNIYYLDINEDGDPTKSVKNFQSIRQIPIHQTLIDLGFIDYVNSIKKTNKTNQRIFPDLTFTQHNGWAGGASKKFSRYLSKIGINKDSKSGHKCYHSFRHSFTTILQSKGVSEEMRNKLQGWSSSNVGTSIYGNHTKLSVLNKELQKLNYGEQVNKAINSLQGWVKEKRPR